MTTDMLCDIGMPVIHRGEAYHCLEGHRYDKGDVRSTVTFRGFGELFGMCRLLHVVLYTTGNDDMLQQAQPALRLVVKHNDRVAMQLQWQLVCACACCFAIW